MTQVRVPPTPAFVRSIGKCLARTIPSELDLHLPSDLQTPRKTDVCGSNRCSETNLHSWPFHAFRG
jgi:hypothetical protein